MRWESREQKHKRLMEEHTQLTSLFEAHDRGVFWDL